MCTQNIRHISEILFAQAHLISVECTICPDMKLKVYLENCTYPLKKLIKLKIEWKIGSNDLFYSFKNYQLIY